MNARRVNEFAWDALNEMAKKGCGLNIFRHSNQPSDTIDYVGKYLYANGLLF
jgi:hypothetical protein